MNQLTNGAESLAELNLHDGQVRRYSYAAGIFTLTVLIGDLQRGYDWAHLTYQGADLVDMPRDGIRRLRLRAKRTELLDHTVRALGDGRFEQRIELWPSQVLTIRFDSVNVGVHAAGPRERR